MSEIINPYVQEDEELEYCQLLRYCEKIDKLEKRKENENNETKHVAQKKYSNKWK